MINHEQENSIVSWRGEASDEKGNGAWVASNLLQFMDNRLSSRSVSRAIDYSRATSEENLYIVEDEDLPPMVSEYKFYSPVYTEESEQEKREDVELHFVKKLKSFEKIKAIYSHERLNTLNFTILLDVDKHDEDLMRSLFKIEYYLRNKFSDHLMDFNYLPILSRDKSDLINPKHKLIFEQNGIGEASFITSYKERGIGETIKKEPFLEGLVNYSEFLRGSSLCRI